MKFWGVSLRTDGFPTVSLDQFQWLKLHTIESMIEPGFPGYRGISSRKNKGKLTWQREKNTTSWRCISPHFKEWWFSSQPASHVRPEGGSRSPPRLGWFQLLCDSRPFSESPLLSAWGEAKRPGWGCWAHDGWAHWVGLFFFFWLGPQKRLEET